MRTSRLSRLAFLLVLGGACATAPAPRPSMRLRLDGRVLDATVWVDDHLAGTLGDLMQRGGVVLPGGYHRVEIRHPAYYSAYREFERDGGEETLSVRLRQLVE